MVRLTIEGIPVSWRAHGGSGRLSFNPRWNERQMYQHIIKRQYKGEPMDGPISVRYWFMVAIPKSWSEKKRAKAENREILPVTRADLGNYEKFLSDCLTGTCIIDDSQIVYLAMQKFYSTEPRTVVILRPLFPPYEIPRIL